MIDEFEARYIAKRNTILAKNGDEFIEPIPVKQIVRKGALILVKGDSRIWFTFSVNDIVKVRYG